ncbi:MAG: hypothetical protein H0U16_07880 [Actinobacteria bacterium]|nr:hypothetical protein [Actinomycetota bacterium]
MVDVDGVKKPILEAPLKTESMGANADNPELSEYLVRIEWLKTVPVEEAYRETGFFGNQNTACRFRHRPTLEKLYQRFDVSEDDEQTMTDDETIASPGVMPAGSP